MKLTIFGATGGIGTELVTQALAAGHHVTAVVRDPGRLRVPEHDALDVVTADVLDPAAIEDAVAGRDAVLSALGPSGGGPTTLNQDSARSIVTAMRATGTTRLLMVTAAVVDKTGDEPLTRYVVKPILNRILGEHYADLRVMEQVVRDSGLDWTLVSAPRLTNGPRTGTVHSNTERNVRWHYSIARADVAAFMLAAAADGALSGKRVSIAG